MTGSVQLLILAAVYSLSLRHGGKAPAKDVSDEVFSLFGKQVSPQHCYCDLTRLQKKGVVEKTGSSRRSMYYIQPDYLSPVEMKRIKDLADDNR